MMDSRELNEPRAKIGDAAGLAATLALSILLLISSEYDCFLKLVPPRANEVLPTLGVAYIVLRSLVL